jgi:imidazolonepropionase
VSVVDLLIKNIKGLVQVRTETAKPLRGRQMGELPVLKDAFLIIDKGLIQDFGSMENLGETIAARTIDASGCFVFPTFVDSHTHLVFPASREDEFVLKIKGSSYQEIAAKGGGILNSAKKLALATEEELLESATARLHEIASTGTGAVEIKSGYGLNIEGECKMLRVANKLKGVSQLAIKTTFLGAHAVPGGVEKKDYIRNVIDDMIPAIASENLADYIDVFCEEGFFSPEETMSILEAGIAKGMKARIHANQLNRSGGVQVGVKVKALSVDHLENIGEEEIAALKGSDVIATALPGAAFFLNLPMPPARRLIEEEIPLVIASDYNPGSAPSGNMMLMVSLACIKMKLTPEEAINAATVNAACALEIQHEFGSITRGKVGSVFITYPVPSIAYLPYAFGSRLVQHTVLRGRLID